MNNPKDISKGFDAAVPSYQKAHGDLSRFDAAFQSFCEALPSEKCQLLEIGCGPGNVLRHLLRFVPDANITGIDLSANMLAAARKAIPTASFLQNDGRDVAALKQAFHGIMLSFFLPYLSPAETPKFLQSISQSLHPGGVICIITMHRDHTHTVQHHSSLNKNHLMTLCYWNGEELSHLIQQNGCEIVSVKYADCPHDHGGKHQDVIIIARKSSA